jgi:hypothetical protein
VQKKFCAALRYQESGPLGGFTVKYLTMLLLQALTSLTATGMITFAVTHVHADLITWSLWALHWIIAWPIAFGTIRWIQPLYRKWLYERTN